MSRYISEFRATDKRVRELVSVVGEDMRIGIFLKILIPFLLALGVSSYLYLRAANQGIESSFDLLIDERIDGIRSGVESEVRDLIDRGESQLKGLAKDAVCVGGLKNIKEGNRSVQNEVITWAIKELGVTGFDVLVVFDNFGWSVANGSDSQAYNEPLGTYGSETDSLIAKALQGEDIGSLRYTDLNGRKVILSENFVPVKYRDEVVGAIWGGRILGQEFVNKLSQISASPLEIVTGKGTVILSSMGTSQPKPGPDYARREFALGDLVSGADVKLRLYVPKGAFKAAGAELKGKIFGYGLVMVVALIVIAALIARGITSPIGRLTKAVDDLSRGKLEGEITVRSGDEIERLVDGFNRMARELDENTRKLLHAEKIAAWREVARRLAHEIKNPLSPIQLSIQSLMKNYEKGNPDFGGRLKQDGETILEEVDRLRRLADEFSAFAKLPKPLMEESDINELVENIARMHSVDTDRVEITTNLDKNIPHIKLDREQIKQVLINLVKNAAEAIDGKGKITLSTRMLPRRSRIDVTVADNGSGMTEEQMRQVFNPYFTTKSGGTGLGLAIALSIVNDHGGRLWVESRKGAGTTFHVELRM